MIVNNYFGVEAVDKENLSLWDEARNHINAGRADKAIEIYKYILLRYADNTEAIEYANAYLGDLYLTSGNFDLAERHLNKAVNLAPGNSSYHYLLGFVYTYQRQWDEAVAEFGIAVTSEPENAEHLRGLGWATFQRGDHKKGLDLLHKADTLAPGTVNILTDLAVAYLNSDPNKAKKYAEAAVVVSPESTLARDVLDKIQGFDREIKQLVKGTRPDWVEILRPSYKVGIFQFKVFLKDTPEIWRIIEIKGNQLLSTLHKAFLKAFDRVEDGPYSFILKRNQNKKQTEFADSSLGISGTAKPAKSIRVDSLSLYLDEGQKFIYLFGYENRCWHEVELVKIFEKYPRTVYPRVVKKQGKYRPP
jgi:hypothetical protein